MNSKQKDEVIALASDHAGFLLKSVLLEDLRGIGHKVLDLGTNSVDSVDYPLFAQNLAVAVATGRAMWGVVLCGTGIGVSIAAKRHPGVRAALCHDVETARLGRQHNNANVLALGARIIDEGTAKLCVREFLATEFEDGGRHAKRVGMLSPVSQTVAL